MENQYNYYNPNENSNNNINMSINEYKKYTINLEKLKVEN